MLQLRYQLNYFQREFTDGNLQAWFAIAALDSWAAEINGFDLEGFYNRIINILSNDQDPLVQNIFNHFDK
jgi:hypothetical protein